MESVTEIKWKRKRKGGEDGRKWLEHCSPTLGTVWSLK